mmetsp:Transcript_84972/g.245706  ORF Transcript_84972/g.245706 Transcript_84972/m.245706 type:complete len:256 (-) Transcript_84972:185-952(-)
MPWLAGVGAAISIKLSSSIDDVVWLAPFLTNNTTVGARIQNSLIYISVCLTQTAVAMAIAYSGDSLVSALTRNKKGAWSSDKILTVFAGGLLAIYSIKLTIEYIQEMNGGDSDDDDDKDQEPKYGQVAVNDEEATKPLSSRHGNDTEQASGDEQDAKQQCSTVSQKEAKQTQTLFVIAFLGSVDDLTLFVPMLVGKGFDIVQLIVGGAIAASTIVSLCLFIGLCKPIADCLAKVPLALIVVVFAITLLVKGYWMD